MPAKRFTRRHLQGLVRRFLNHPAIGADDPAAAERAAQLTVILSMEVFLSVVSLVLHITFGDSRHYLERIQMLFIFFAAGCVTLYLARTRHYLKVSFLMVTGLLILMMVRIGSRLAASDTSSLYLDMATMGCTAMLGTLVLPPGPALVTALLGGISLIFQLWFTAEHLAKELWAGVLLYFSCGLFTITGAYTREYFLNKMLQAKRVAEEQYRHRTRLQDELSQKEAEKQVALRMSEMKTKFLSQVSHEIRTPLHAILAFARFGVSKSQSAPPDKLLEYFQEIQASGQNLMNLLSHILDLSKIESGKMEYEFSVTDFKAICIRSVREFRLAADERNLTLDCPAVLPSVYLKMDEARIGQVLKNLISNAVKYSLEGTMVSLRWAVQRTDWSKNPCLAFSIYNKGSLFAEGSQNTLHPQEELGVLGQNGEKGHRRFSLNELFAPFSHFSRPNTGPLSAQLPLGTGLGLNICKEIIEAHAGRIWVTLAQENETVAFHFAIPQQPLADPT